MQLQMVIFDFEEEETGTKHVATAASKCVPSGIFRRVPRFNSIASFLILAEIFLILCHTTALAQP